MKHASYNDDLASSRTKQAGSVLIIGMLLLLMMTLLGLITTSETRTDARITSNTLDRAIAFQAAEAALRDAESTIQCYESTDPSACSTTCSGDQFFYDTDEDPPQDDSKWDTACDSGVDLPDVSDPPLYIIDKLDPSSVFGGYVVVGEVYHARTNSVYRVTVLSYGRSSDTQVILETTFVPAAI